MFPIFGIIGEGLKAGFGFARAYPWHVVAIYGVSLTMACIGASGIIRLPLPLWLSGLLITWLLTVFTALILAPVWTALYRFAVLGDRSRSIREFDRRTLRVAMVMLVLAFVSLLGAVPFALGLDILPLIGARRLVFFGAITFAALVKLGGFWLNARLAIAPAMAAAGAKPQALDTSFAYTRWASIPVLATFFVIYVPHLTISAALIAMPSMLDIRPGSPPAIGLFAVNILLSTVLSATTDLVWGGVIGRLAVKLVKVQRARAAEAARRARDGRDDDDD